MSCFTATATVSIIAKMSSIDFFAVIFFEASSVTLMVVNWRCLGVSLVCLVQLMLNVHNWMLRHFPFCMPKTYQNTSLSHRKFWAAFQNQNVEHGLGVYFPALECFVVPNICLVVERLQSPHQLVFPVFGCVVPAYVFLDLPCWFNFHIQCKKLLYFSASH